MLLIVIFSVFNNFDTGHLLWTSIIRSFLISLSEISIYKIREAQKSKIPITIVLGDNEVKNETVSVRLYNQKKQFILKLDELISYIEKM